MKTLLIATGFALTSISSAVMAHDSHNSCNINFDKDISINSELVSMKAAGTELWRINSNGQLWLDGRAVDTDRNTQKLLRDYQAGIRTQTLETVALVEDALVLAADAVDSVLTELTGDSLDSHPALQQALDKIKTSTESIVVRSGDTIDIYGSRFDSVDDTFGAEFEQAIEEAVTSSMGSILMIVGKAMSTGEGNFEQRMEAFGEKMQRFGEDLETRMQSKAQLLEQRGDAMCGNLKQLDALESQIQQAIPKMQQYDLFDVSSDNKTAFYLYN
jgi:predicted ribosome quality control (RQC) complex YloA/Tae2 family protein